MNFQMNEVLLHLKQVNQTEAAMEINFQTLMAANVEKKSLSKCSLN